MFVQREDDPSGLFVLMPDMSNHHHEPHCAVMVVESDYTKTGSAMMYPLWHKEIDFRKFGHSDDKVWPLDWTLNASKYALTRVAPRFLDDAPTDCLACRIDLPLGLVVKPYGLSGLMDVEGFSDQITVFGRSYVDLAFDDQTLDSISIGGATLYPNDAGELRIYFLNIQLCDLNKKKPRKSHAIGDESYHPQSYYWLLDGYCSSHKAGPKFKIADEIVGDGSACPPSECPKKPRAIVFTPPEVDTFVAGADPGIPWVDTHDCSQGSGDPM